MLGLSIARSADGFMPHGMCYLWQPGILSLHVASDSLIALAYASIPFTLLYFTARRRDLGDSWILVCFAVFIVACGASHVMEIVTIWYPAYWLAGAVKAVTAAASVATAILLARLVPAALRIPSPADLVAANGELKRESEVRRRVEIDLRRTNDSLELRVAARTAELEATNATLTREIRDRKQSEELLAVTLASLHEGVIVTDLGGQITFINDAAARLVNCERYQAYDAPLTTVFKVLDPATLAPVERLVAAVVENEPADGGLRDVILVSQNGKLIPIDLRATRIRADELPVRGIVLTFRDYTERMHAEEQLRVAIEAAPTGMIMTDGDGAMVLVNAEILRLFGYERSELIGQNIEILVPTRHRERHPDLRRQFYTELKTRAMGRNADLYGLRKDGTEVPVEIMLNPIQTHAGHFVLSTVMDITERRRSVAQLRELNEHLNLQVAARTAQLKDREAMIQEIHHRVKNNLQVISSLINMQMRSIPDSVTRQALNDCRSRVETMSQIHEMLYQAEDYARVPFSDYARTLVQRVISTSELRPASVTPRFDLEPFSLTVEKAIPCGLILNELVVNAIKHAFPGGTTGTIEVGLHTASEDTLCLSVSDNGIGLPAHVSVEQAGSLGMQLIAILVQQLHGNLQIHRENGLAYHLTFPT